MEFSQATVEFSEGAVDHNVIRCLICVTTIAVRGWSHIPFEQHAATSPVPSSNSVDAPPSFSNFVHVGYSRRRVGD